MKMFRNRIVLVVALAGALLLVNRAAADPKGGLFDRLYKAGKQHAAERRNSQKSTVKRSRSKRSSSRKDQNVEGVVEPVVEAASPTPAPMIRAASQAPARDGRRVDIPYAIPVPDRPGFVTSPYAPQAGLVDVRAFPSGTEVKDPYTGKTFLTP